MNRELPSPPGFWRTVGWLLRAARKRSEGQRTRRQKLLHQRSGTDWGILGVALAVLVMLVLNVLAAFVLRSAVTSGQRVAAESQGKIGVSSSFLASVKSLKSAYDDSDRMPDHPYSDLDYPSEAKRIERAYGGKAENIEAKLRDAVRNHGVRDLISNQEAAPGVAAFMKSSSLPAMLGSVVLIWWGVMLVFQGEGVELDLQRRRHPMWEWLFSHPVPAGAVFLAEMFSPIAANPIYWGAPLFVGLVYGFVYDPLLAMLAILLIGVPITVAAACMGKALEIGVILRFSPRSRGAVVGLMGWMGYASTMLFFLGLFIVPKIVNAVGRYLSIFTVLPWPWLRLFLGAQADGSFSFLAGMAACWSVAAITAGCAVWFSVWGSQQGLSGNFGEAGSRPKAAKKTGTKFGKDPLYRKELLWFTRDRSAVVQAILIPMTVASFQLFNFRGLLNDVQGAWNYLSGAAILFGTYFLWILGPKSLASEGNALWIALTWPRGLESLLKAKAWLWSLISSCMVAMVLCYAAYLFPESMWKIALVGVGWFFFSRSMAEKSVTLVTVTSQSGEPEKIPAGRRWAAQLGMLTFSIGVLMQQWPLAVIGIVYSYITAAAMWQNFRARLPYLYDPWSEKLPPPPTLMHAMIAISILVDAGAVLTGIVSVGTGPENIALAQAISYGICAVCVSLGMTSFLSERGVVLSDVLRWPATAVRGRWESWWHDQSEKGKLPLSLLLGAAAGVALGLFAHGYVAVLQHFPTAAELINKSREQMANMPGARISYAVMAVGFAPFAEEYLFRGLLFRSLDREWGGWRAVVGSAAFFAIYHPPLSWLPVALLGVANALIFKKTGRLTSAIALHMVYNAVVLM
jgi:membrane protease YdiL (CAAX protease family)